MQSTEVIVIGAGPAGSTAACLLARSGVQVLVTDRASFPRKKLCGGCLSQAGYKVLQAHQLETISSLAGSSVIHRLDLSSAHRRMSLSLPPYRVIDRAVFDTDLVHAATKAGATFLPETLAHVRPDHTVELTRSGQEPKLLTARVIIIADGIKGVSLRMLEDFKWRIDPAARVGIGGMIGSLPPGCDPNAITMLHGQCGYAGIAPLNTGHALIAAAVDPSWIGEPHTAPPLLALLHELGLSLEADTPMSLTGGAPGLTRRRNTIEADGQIFLIGDATGYIEPFTGEGMTWALQDACMITQHARARLTNNYEHGDWTTQHRLVNRKRKALCTMSTKLLRKPLLTRALMSASSKTPMLTSVIASGVSFMQQHDLQETRIA